MSKIRGFKNRVVVEPMVAQTSIGGLLIPETTKSQPPMFGKVLSAGPGITIKGVFRPTGVEEGDYVIFARNGGEKIKVGDQEVIILPQDQIFGVVTSDAIPATAS